MTDKQQEILNELGRKVKALRQERGMTLKDMSYKIDKEPQSVSRLEMGKVNPSYLYLLDICRALDVDLNTLLK